MVKIILYKGNPTRRRKLHTELCTGQFQILLTTYEYIINDCPVLCEIKWVHMITGEVVTCRAVRPLTRYVDENHRIKNTQSKLAQTLTQYYHSFPPHSRWTPLQQPSRAVVPP